MRRVTAKRNLPRLSSDKEAEDFVARSDLTKYKLSDMRLHALKFASKSTRASRRPVAPAKNRAPRKARA